jgi:DNA-binding PadR family transcriptional regulator
MTDELPLAEAVCLALIAREPVHGWALVRTLAPGGDIGRIWSLSRPLTYRAIDHLVARGLVEPVGEESGAGPRRRVLAATARGRRGAREWCATPVAHPRDIRTEFLLKLQFGPDFGLDPRGLAAAQREALAPVLAGLERAAKPPDADFVDRWRAESARAVRRFLDAI